MDSECDRTPLPTIPYFPHVGGNQTTEQGAIKGVASDRDRVPIEILPACLKSAFVGCDQRNE